MSKRAGTVITLEDFVDALGVDAARYALARYSSDSQIDIDIELWTRASSDNPVYYVQYVAARTASVARNAAEVGLTRGDADDFHPELLEPREGERPAQGARASTRPWWPARPSCASRTGSPATWRSWRATTTGSTTSAGCCRWATSRSPTCTGRGSWLNDATRTVIANGLGLLGVSAPERM